MTVYLVDEPSIEIAMSYASGDSSARIFLLQDAVYAAVRGEVEGEVYVLKEDLLRRGLGSKVPPRVRAVGYADLVHLMEEEKVVNLL